MSGLEKASQIALASWRRSFAAQQMVLRAELE